MTLKNVAALLAAALFAGGCATAPGPASYPAHPLVSSFSASPVDTVVPPGWEPWVLSRFKKATRYEVVERDGRTVLRASADASASGLVHRLDLDPAAYPLLTWQWKVNELIAAADNTRQDAEDSPARIIVTFDGDPDKLPFGERAFADLFRMATGQALPYATLMYVWENRLDEGTVIANRHTSRIQMIVARSGGATLGAWQMITRNVAEDYRRAFGEAPGRITGVAIMTDADNTGASASAYYGDIQFHGAPQPVISDSR